MLILQALVIASLQASSSVCATRTSLWPSQNGLYLTSPSELGGLNEVANMTMLSTNSYTTIRHPAYPRHNLRIKRNGASFCDDTVQSYTGYLDVDARHLFFMFFESRSDPQRDDVLFWTNGGPGCSASTGLFMELGPCRIKDSTSTEFNPYSWNARSNIFFIDQPVGAGYSYADHGEYVDNTEDAAKDIAAFVRLFFDVFSEFQGRPFHLAGESYAGRMLPLFAAAIIDDNSRAIVNGSRPVNLTSVMIGNGCGDNGRMIPSYYDIQCTSIAAYPIQDISKCVQMKKALPRCKRMLEESCIDIFDHMACSAAYTFCWEQLASPFLETGLNVYDVSTRCSIEEYLENTCYPITQSIKAFLDRPDIRSQLGVDPSVGPFQDCNIEVVESFDKANEYFYRPTELYTAQLLERGVRVLIYVGANDFICNWVGNERSSLALDWTGKDTFATQPLREWEMKGRPVGKAKTANGLTFATVYGAGHFMPYDQPAVALDLVTRWLEGREF